MRVQFSSATAYNSNQVKRNNQPKTNACAFGLNTKISKIPFVERVTMDLADSQKNVLQTIKSEAGKQGTSFKKIGELRKRLGYYKKQAETLTKKD